MSPVPKLQETVPTYIQPAAIHYISTKSKASDERDHVLVPLKIILAVKKIYLEIIQADRMKIVSFLLYSSRKEAILQSSCRIILTNTRKKSADSR